MQKPRLAWHRPSAKRLLHAARGSWPSVPVADPRPYLDQRPSSCPSRAMQALIGSRDGRRDAREPPVQGAAPPRQPSFVPQAAVVAPVEQDCASARRRELDKPDRSARSGIEFAMQMIRRPPRFRRQAPRLATPRRMILDTNNEKCRHGSGCSPIVGRPLSWPRNSPAYVSGSAPTSSTTSTCRPRGPGA